MRRPKLKTWAVKVEVFYPEGHPSYQRVAVRLRVDMPGESAEDAASTVLALPRAQWPEQWKVEEF